MPGGSDDSSAGCPGRPGRSHARRGTHLPACCQLLPAPNKTAVEPRAGALSESAATWVCGLLLAGILIFSGSLYALALTGIRTFGAITPIGGISFIAAWFVLAFRLLRR